MPVAVALLHHFIFVRKYRKSIYVKLKTQALNSSSLFEANNIDVTA